MIWYDMWSWWRTQYFGQYSNCTCFVFHKCNNKGALLIFTQTFNVPHLCNATIKGKNDFPYYLLPLMFPKTFSFPLITLMNTDFKNTIITKSIAFCQCFSVLCKLCSNMKNKNHTMSLIRVIWIIFS